jgi:hypothetical protein
MADDGGELLFDALEGHGILGHVRAIIRTAVFTSIDEHERKAGIFTHNDKALAMQKSAEGEAQSFVLEPPVELWAHKCLCSGAATAASALVCTGKLALQVICNFLDHFKLEQTSACLRSETGLVSALYMRPCHAL